MNDETSQSGRLERLVGRLRNCAQAYPDDMFLPTTHEQRAEHGTLITQAAAAMGRHFSPLFTEAADEIERLRAENDALRDKLDSIEVQGSRTVVSGWVCIPEVEWDSLTPNAALSGRELGEKQ